ncbi:pyocin activator PrtN family protein [Hahella sp. KA22]|uniref:pyocin activator PrtN family protein n=1 Tax=Hahella sp. KA22 TaxID=1628392 RepID=UPI0019D42A20|nr:pyocin activator PrtN family protein [Hahella sp. KA22]
MNTMFLLLAEFETSQIPLVDVAAKYFNLTTRRDVQQRAKLQKFPFPVYRASNSNAAEWIVHAKDLAEWIDKERETAVTHWKSLNGAPPRGVMARRQGAT